MVKEKANRTPQIKYEVTVAGKNSPVAKNLEQTVTIGRRQTVLVKWGERKYRKRRDRD